MKDLLSPKEAMVKVKYFATLAKVGAITYDKGFELCKLPLYVVNKRGKEIADKYNQKYYKITFTSLIR